MANNFRQRRAARAEAPLVARGAALSREGQHALVAANSGVIFYVLRQYFPAPYPEDVVQEGWEALVIAASKFDPSRGVQFNTYATWWVRARALMWLMSRGPVVAFKTAAGRKVFSNIGRARRKLGPDATLAQVADEIGVSQRDVEACLPRLDRADQSFEQLEEARGALADGSALADATCSDAERAVAVRVALAALPERERIIIERRFLADDDVHLAVLGREWGVCRERVRQIQVQALRSLRVALGDLR